MKVSGSKLSRSSLHITVLRSVRGQEKIEDPAPTGGPQTEHDLQEKLSPPSPGRIWQSCCRTHAYMLNLRTREKS